MKAVLYFLWILFFAIVVEVPVCATHIRAGQITAVRDAGSSNILTYILTLTLYRETKGVDQPQASLSVSSIINTQLQPVATLSQLDIPARRMVEA